MLQVLSPSAARQAWQQLDSQTSMKSDASSISPISKQGSGNLGVKGLAPAFFKQSARAEPKSPWHDSPRHAHHMAAQTDASLKNLGGDAKQESSSLAPLGEQQKQLQRLRIHGSEQSHRVERQQLPVQLQGRPEAPRSDAEASSSSGSSSSVDGLGGDMPEESDIGTSAGPSHQATAGAMASGASRDNCPTASQRTAASLQAMASQVCTWRPAMQASGRKLVIHRMQAEIRQPGGSLSQRCCPCRHPRFQSSLSSVPRVHQGPHDAYRLGPSPGTQRQG